MTRRFSIDRRQLEEPSPQPLDEAELTTRIAKILGKTPKAAALRSTSQGWLGEREDRDLVDRYLAATEGSSASAASALAGEADADPLFARVQPPASGAGDSSVWVTKARHQRLRGKLRDASAWAVSIVVAVVLVGAASVALFGWPEGDGPLQQIRVRAIDVSAADSTPGDLLANTPVGKLPGSAGAPARSDVR